MRKRCVFTVAAIACLLAPVAIAQDSPWSLLKSVVRDAFHGNQAPANPPERHDQPASRDTAEEERADLERGLGKPFRKTRFTGLYELDSSDKEGAAILSTAKGRITFNNGILGPRWGIDGPVLGGEEVKSLMKQWIPQLDVRGFIQKGGKGPVHMVVLSAIDCPYCRTLEARLDAANVRYAIAPTALMNENWPIVRAIYCSPDPAGAWTRALQRGKRPLGEAECNFDADHFRVVSALLGGSTPRILYADGELSRPPGSLQTIKARLTSLEESGIQF